MWHSGTRPMAGFSLALMCAASLAQVAKRLAQVADTLARYNHFSGTVLVAKGDHILLDRGFLADNVRPNSSVYGLIAQVKIRQ